MKEPPYITCREFIDFIAEYLEKSLTDAQRREFERHLKVCPSCDAYLSGYIETIRLGKSAMKPSDDPAPVPESLIEAIRSARKIG